MENFSSKKATRTLVQKFASDWFNTDDRTLIYQPNTSNVFSASSEIRVHPPQDMTTSSKCDLDSKVVSIRRASSTLNDEVDLDEFVHMLNPKALDPQHLFAKRLQMSSQPEVLAPIHVYRHQFHEFISTLSNVLQTRCVDGRVRAALTSARNELQGQLNNLRRILNQREAAEDGWEYVDQWSEELTLTN